VRYAAVVVAMTIGALVGLVAGMAFVRRARVRRSVWLLGGHPSMPTTSGRLWIARVVRRAGGTCRHARREAQDAAVRTDLRRCALLAPVQPLFAVSGRKNRQRPAEAS
jgi:hypothetical protein